MKTIIVFLLGVFCYGGLMAQKFEINAFSIYAPLSDEAEAFNTFIEDVLAPGGINTIIIQVDYGYEWTTHPELREEKALTKAQIKSMLAVCKKHGIKLMPQMNMIGHQSEGSKLKKLLAVYPEFDETPKVKMPENYVWPNPDKLYCKSYCPLHPQIHEVLFDIIGEICEAFETNDFHAGLDEIFYLTHEDCPRCQGLDPAVVLANEIRTLHDFLASKNIKMWMWGDRLLDGKSSGIGMWEASYNNTQRAIDWIPKDIMICDWHYKKAIPTAPYFAMKGFDVVSCPWNQPEVAAAQYALQKSFKENSTDQMASHYKGVMQTVWSPVSEFIRQHHDYKPTTEKSQVASLRMLMGLIQAE